MEITVNQWDLQEFTVMEFYCIITLDCFCTVIHVCYYKFSISRCDCISKLQGRLDYLRSILDDPVHFKNIYRYAFDFARVICGYIFGFHIKPF